MAESDNIHDEDTPNRPARVDRHRIARDAAEQAVADKAAADTAAAENAAEIAWEAPAPPAPRMWRKPPGRVERPPLNDKTTDAVRRPALLSDRCLACGASTKGAAGMLTELVEAGPIRALRVVACSSCPDRRRRGLGNV